VVPGGREERILSLVAPNRTQAPVLPGTWFDRIEVLDDAIIFVLSGRDPPADPVSIRVAWDADASGYGGPPPWRLEIKETAASGALAESVALLRARIEKRLTPEAYLALLLPVSDPVRDWGEDPPRWTERLVGAFGLVWRERDARGLVQYGWRDVDVIAPALPPGWVLAPLLALLAAGISAGLRRLRRGDVDPTRPRTWWPFVAGSTVPLAAAAAWWFHAPLSEAASIVADHPRSVLAWLVPAQREFALAQVFLGAALLLSVLGVVDAARKHEPGGAPARRPVRLLSETIVIAAASFAVRLGMAASNLYSCGAGGFDRLLRYVPGEGGGSVMVAWLLPDAEHGFIWTAVRVAAALAALGPPLLYLLGRSLRLSAAASFTAGLAFACWPLHAMISASDLLAGPLLSVGIAAWVFSACAVRRDRPLLLLPAAGLLAWALWCRQDGILLLLPAIGLTWSALPGWRARPELWAAAAWLGLSVLCRLFTWPGVPGPEPWVEGEPVSQLLRTGHAAFPWWMVAVIPGVMALRGRRDAALPVALGAGAAALSVVALRPLFGQSAWIEGGAFLMPWVALLCGTGVEAAAGYLPKPALRPVLFASFVAGVLLVPFFHADQLDMLHGPAKTDKAFREELKQVDPHCGILVTSTEGSLLKDPGRRYRLIAWEEFERNPDRPRGDKVVTEESGKGKRFSCYNKLKGSYR